MTSENKVYVLHENSEWVVPLRFHFESLNIPYEEWFLSEGFLKIDDIPPQGVFYNRMSASSHTRNHRYAVELTEATISWLERFNRRVINDHKSIHLEVRKTEQYLQLNKFGITTPYTVATVGKAHLLEEAKKFNRPFITKPNRGGKGLGVTLFQSAESLEKQFETDPIESIDGIILLQEYIKPRESHIIRMEFIGGKFFYAVKVDTSCGFELCPADDCHVDDEFCPALPGGNMFEVLENFYTPEIPQLETFLVRNGIEIGAIEFVENDKGERYFYDVNVNTNYNAEAEGRNENRMQGMRAIADFLGQELDKIQNRDTDLEGFDQVQGYL